MHTRTATPWQDELRPRSGEMEHDPTQPGPRPGPRPRPQASDSLGRKLLRQRMFPAETELSAIGRYVILRFVGAGGMGQVFAAYDPVLDRKVAIKLLPAQFSHDLDQRTRLLREAQALAKLSHANVVQVYEAGEHEGQVYVVMEYVDGQTLGEYVSADPRPSTRDILARYIEAGRGLAAAHAAGLVHRDFKPSNVIVDQSGCARVLDFGLVAGSGEPLSADAQPDTSAELRALDVELTTTGTMLGTPAYMAPEQFAGAPVDARTDQFGFCVALYEALTGARPFAGDTLRELERSVGEGVRARSTRGPSRRLAHVIDRGLASEPDARWPSMDALLDALRPPSRGRIAAVTAAVLAPILGLGGWSLIDRYERELDASAALLEAQVEAGAAETERADRLAFEREVIARAQRASAVENSARTPGRELEALALGVELLAELGPTAEDPPAPAVRGLSAALGGLIPLAQLDRADRLVGAVALSADGSLLLTTPSRPNQDSPDAGAASASELELWSTQPPQRLRSLTLDDLELSAHPPQLSPDNHLLAVATARRCLIHALDTGARVHTLDDCTDPHFSTDGRTLLAAVPCPTTSEGDARHTCAVAAWSLDDGAQRWRRPVPGHQRELLVHPDGERLIVRHDHHASEAIELLSTATGERLASLKRSGARRYPKQQPFRPGLTSLSSNGRKLAALETDDGGRLVVWDLDTHRPELVDVQPPGWGWFFDLPLLSHDGSELLIHGTGLTIHDLDAGQTRFTDSGSSRGVALPSRWLALTSGAWLERPRTGARQPAPAVDALIADPEGRFVISTAKGSARLWSPAEHLTIERWMTPARERVVALGDDQDDQIVTWEPHGPFRLYPRTGQPEAAQVVETTHPHLRPLQFAAERPTRALFRDGDHFEVLELGAAQPPCRVDAAGAKGVALSPDGLQLAVRSETSGEVVVWDIDTCRERERFVLPGADGRLYFGAGGLIGARHWPTGVSVYRHRDGRIVRIDEQCTNDEASWARLSPDGRMLLSCCNGLVPEHNPARLWDTETGALIRELDLRDYSMEGQISSDGQLMLINAGAHHIAAVRLADGRELLRIPGRLGFGQLARTRAGEHGLVLDLGTRTRGLVTMPLSVPGLVAAACEVLGRSELAARTADACRQR